MNPFERILILAPHTDDGELGCGGAIAKFIEKGSKVFYAAFSSAYKSIPSHLPVDILAQELRAAVDTLGILKDNLILFDYPVREFPTYRQEILEDMIRLNQQIDPSLVFLPARTDSHQDHQVIFSEGFRAFKKKTMLGYELPWNNLTFETSSFFILRREHIQKKIEALACYHSQKDRRYFSPEFITSLARTRGVQLDTDFAEAFDVIRWIAP